MACRRSGCRPMRALRGDDEILLAADLSQDKAGVESREGAAPRHENRPPGAEGYPDEDLPAVAVMKHSLLIGSGHGKLCRP